VPPLDASKSERERLVLDAELWWCKHVQKHFWVVSRMRNSNLIISVKIKGARHMSCQIMEFCKGLKAWMYLYSVCGVFWFEEMTDNEQNYHIGWWYPKSKCTYIIGNHLYIPQIKMYTIHHIISNHPALIESYTISNVNQTKIWMSRPRQVTTEKHSK